MNSAAKHSKDEVVGDFLDRFAQTLDVSNIPEPPPVSRTLASEYSLHSDLTRRQASQALVTSLAIVEAFDVVEGPCARMVRIAAPLVVDEFVLERAEEALDDRDVLERLGRDRHRLPSAPRW